MTLIKSHTCTKCGGALTVHNDRQQYECPYCSVFYDYEYFRSQDILDQAASSLKVLQFDSAKEKYDFLLQKEPHNFIALQGKILSESKINRPSELLKIARVAQISPETISDAAGKALPENKPYFETLMEMNTIAREYCADAKPKKKAAAKEEMDLTGLCDISKLYEDMEKKESFKEKVSNFFKGKDPELEFIEKEKNEKAAANRAKSPSAVEAAQKKAVRDQFVELSVKLFEQDPQDREKLGIASGDGGDEKEDNVTTVTLQNSQCCTGCGGELIVNLSRQLYECPFCGLTFDFDFIRDETAEKEAAEALSKKQFIKADAIFAYILTVDPSNFEALRGRILCAAKWTAIPTISVIGRMRKVYLPSMEARIDEAIEKSKESDRPYFKQFKRIIPQVRIYNQNTSPYEKNRQNKQRLEDGHEEVGDYIRDLERERSRVRWSNTYGNSLIGGLIKMKRIHDLDDQIMDAYSTKEILWDRLDETNDKIKVLNEKGKAAERQIGAILKELVEWEKNRNSPKDVTEEQENDVN